MRLVLVAMAAVLLAGCALDLSGTAWKKPDAMFQHVTAAEMACARQTYEVGYGLDLVFGGLLDLMRLGVNEARLQLAFRGCRGGNLNLSDRPNACEDRVVVLVLAFRTACHQLREQEAKPDGHDERQHDDNDELLRALDRR